MYVPDHFALAHDDCLAVLGRLGGADLITVHADGPDATYLPLDYVPAGAPLPGGTGQVGPLGSLVGHVARNNPQASTPTVAPSLVIAHDGDHYVSPADMPSHGEHGRIVPTWDYMTVQAYGELVRHDDPAWLLASVRALTERHEEAWALRDADTGAAITPVWSVDDAPADYIERMLRAVVGVELRIDRLVGKAKMSQNKAPEDVEGQIEALHRRALDQLAAYKRQVSLPAARRRQDLLRATAARHGGADGHR